MSKSIRTFLFLVCSAAVSAGFGQSCVPTNINGTIINLSCNQTCSTLTFRVPHLKSSSDYTLTTIPYNPYPYSTPGGNELTILYTDDEFSNVINIPFGFCFYDSVFNAFVVGSNGVMTFDLSNQAPCDNGYNISASSPAIPGSGGGGQCTRAGPYYPRSSIMGNFSDLDPTAGASPPNRKIEWRVEGTAPCRRVIVSYYQVGIYGGSCGASFPNTFQMVLYESTGIVEIFTEQKSLCTASTSSGRAIMGIQNWDWTKAVPVPGRNPAQWSANNEAHRFTPSGASSRFVSSQLFTLSGTLVATADTLTTVPGMLDIRYQNFCPPPGNNTYVVRTIFSDCANPGNQLISSDTIQVNRVNALNAAATATNTGCIAPTGSITITVSGGTSPFTYILDGGTPVVGPSPYTFNNVSAGPHSIQITDASGTCSTTVNVTVVQNSITATASTTATSCPSANNGTIVIGSASGAGPYTFSLDGGAAVPGTIPFTFSNVSPGNHTVVVTDLSSGCATAPISVNVAAGPALTAVATSTGTACAGTNNGTITITSASGTGPYSFSLDGGAPVPGSLPFTFSNVSAGSHTIVVSETSTGCVTPPITVIVAAGPGPAGNATTAPTSCPSVNNGSVTVNATAGTAPFTFTLNGGSPQSGSNPYTFTNVPAGTHTVVITDNYGCSVTINNIVVAAGPVLNALTVAGATSCNGASNGTIIVSPTSGTAPYTYSLNGGPPQSGPAPFTFTGVPAGSHTVVVADAVGCVSNPISVVVVAGPNLSTTATAGDVLCNGGNTGSITVTQPSVGDPPFEYSLDGTNWQSSNVFTGLAAGNYTVYFREGNGCQGSLSISVNEPTPVTATVSSIPAVCNGQSNGVINVAAGGGVPGYQYSIDGGANWQSGSSFTVAAGNYTVLIRDVNGCTISRTVSVTEPAALTANSNTANASCDGGNDGRITVNATGGNGNYEYSVDGVNFQPSNVFNVAPGSYTITVRDNRNCNYSFSATVGMTNNMTMTPQPDVTICEGGSAQLSLNTNATVFAWTPATGLSSTSISNPVASPSVTTQYIVTATLGRCNANDTLVVTVSSAPVPDAGPGVSICYGQSYQLQGTGGAQYSWSPTTYLSSASVANPVSRPARTITYTLSVVDANGCPSLIADTVTIDVTPPLKVNTLPFDTVAHTGDRFQLSASGNFPNPNFSYFWSPATGLSDPNVSNPYVTIGAVGDVVVYRVTMTTPAGCQGEGYVRVRVYKGPDIYIPTAFTPNGDGRNDRLTPFPVGIQTLKYFRVYNRWGQLVFSTTRLHEGWDGTITGKEQATGVFVWIAEAVTIDGNNIRKQGTVTLIR